MSDLFLTEIIIMGISKNLCINELIVRLSLSKPYQMCVSLTYCLRQAQADRVLRDTLI